MIDVAVDIIKKHLKECYPNEEFSMITCGKEIIFCSSTRWRVRILLGLTDNGIRFDMSHQVRKKKILEGQLRLIGGERFK